MSCQSKYCIGKPGLIEPTKTCGFVVPITLYEKGGRIEREYKGGRRYPLE